MSDTAIEALKYSEFPNNSDTISRQAAIDGKITAVISGQAIEAIPASYIKQLPSAQPQACDDAISREDAKWVVFCNRDHVEDQTNAIDSLPCAQPQRMKGRWIPVTNGRGGYECDQCHNYAPSYQDGVEWLSDFCPNCGAWMRGKQNEKTEHI